MSVSSSKFLLSTAEAVLRHSTVGVVHTKILLVFLLSTAEAVLRRTPERIFCAQVLISIVYR